MPRISRKDLKTSFFHIITQGINKDYIFNYPMDIKYYIKTMYKLKDEYKISIIAYCIMNNHTHMLLNTENINNLSKYMHSLNTKYGIYYNKKYDRVGYVFRERYKSEGIYSEEQLYNCIRYIYNNPVKAGMCKTASEYPYSNYKHMYEDNKRKDVYNFIDVEEDKEQICQVLINEFLQKNKLELVELKYNKRKLRELVIILRDECEMSFREISRKTEVNRETVRQLYMNF